MDLLDHEIISIHIEGDEERFSIQSSGGAEKTKRLLLSAVCYMIGIPAHHVKDAEAFLSVLGSQYREEEGKEYH